MSEPTDDEPKRRGGNPLMVRGGPSLNPKGRPPRGASLAERVRRRVDVDALIDVLASIAGDEDAKHSDRVAAARELLDRGFGKSLTTVDVHATAGTDHGGRLDLTSMPLDDQRRLLDAIRSARLGAGDVDGGS